MANNVGISVTAKTKGVQQSLGAITGSLKNINKGMGTWYNETRKLNQRFVNLNKDANRTANSIGGIGKAMKQLAGSATVMALGNAIARMTQSAIESIETANLFNVSLGTMSDEAMKTVDALSTLYGLDPTNIKNTIGTYALLAKSMGMTAEQAEILGTNTTRMAVDLSSLMNVPIEQVMADLRSGLVGQSETVYKYGMDVTEAGLKEEALAQGITKSVRNMSQGEKMALRYSKMIRTVSADLGNGTAVVGDFARTINTPANQLKILSERFTTLGRSIGTIFLPILQTILPYLNAMVQVLIKVANTIASFFGYTADMSDGFGATSGVASLAEDADSATDAVDGTTDALKKLKNTSLGMDELNTVETDSSAGSSSGSGVGGASMLGDFEMPSLADMDSLVKNSTDAIVTKIEKALDKIEKALNPTTEALKKLWNEGLSKLGTFVSTGLTDFYNNFLVPVGGWVLGEEGLPRLINILNEGLKGIDFDSINQNLADFWTAIAPYATEFGAGLIDFFEDVSLLSTDIINAVLGKDGTLSDVTNVLNSGDPENARQWGYALGVIATALAGIGLASTIVGGLAPVMNGLATAFGTISTVSAPFTAMFAEGGVFGTGGALATASTPVIALTVGLAGLVLGLGYVIATNGDVRQSFLDVLSAIVDSLQPAITFFTDTIIPDLQLAWQGFIDVIKPFAEFLETVFTSIWEDMIIPVLQYLADTIIPNVIDIFSDLWNDILVPLGTFIGDVLSPIIEYLSKILGILWEDVVVPLATALGGVFKSAWSGIYDILNDKIIPIVNGVIDVLKYIWKKVLKPLVEYLLDTFAKTFKDVFDGIKEIIEGLQEVFQGVIDFITGVFNGDLEKALKGVSEIFEGAMKGMDGIARGILNGIISMMESMINGIIKGINFLINAINKINIDVPEWLEEISGISSLGFSIPNASEVTLPRISSKLARGGSLSAGQYFEAGENGKAELLGSYQGKTTVMPLENSGFIESMYQAVYDAVTSAQDNGGSVVENVINLDGEVIYKNQQKVASSKGIDFGMGVFAR